jgi:hypothetical protein
MQAISGTLSETESEIWNGTGCGTVSGCVSAKVSVAACHVRYEGVDVDVSAT